MTPRPDVVAAGEAGHVEVAVPLGGLFGLGEELVLPLDVACDDGRLAIGAIPRRRRRGDSAVVRCGVVAGRPRARKLLRNYGTLAAFSSCAVTKKGRSVVRRVQATTATFLVAATLCAGKSRL